MLNIAVLQIFPFQYSYLLCDRIMVLRQEDTIAQTFLATVPWLATINIHFLSGIVVFTLSYNSERGQF